MNTSTKVVSSAGKQIARRYRQVSSLVSKKGLRGAAEKLGSNLATHFLMDGGKLPVKVEDVIAADLSVRRDSSKPLAAGETPVINWVMVPAGPKSGGHTTVFRIIRYLESHGFKNRIYFYNIWDADHEHYKSITRSFYGFDGEVRPLEEGMRDAHAVIATSWSTAYPVFNSKCKGKRFYFVQDFEPHFHPVGAANLFAENTYRMGFHAITAGDWLAEKLSVEYGMQADAFSFGSDVTTYRLDPKAKRSGVVFYARPEAPRRGYELGILAMEIFAKRRPDIDIHFYGNKINGLNFPVINHGRIEPEELNHIYNKCFGGLSLSLTNVSLVPHEMLAAGCIPVVNDAKQNRMVLKNSFVRYAAPEPHALAKELEALTTIRDFGELAEEASASVNGSSWDDAGATVDRILRLALQTAV